MTERLRKPVKKTARKRVRTVEEVPKPLPPKPRSKVRKRDKAHTLRAVPMGVGIPNISKMSSELLDMTDVLMGRVPPPVDVGHLTLMEVADAYFARASEMTMLIQKSEREGFTARGTALYHFRTGELRTFMEMAKKAADLGSRRLTAEQLHYEMELHGRESKGYKG